MGSAIDPLDIPPRLVIDIGMIAVQWARVEFILQKMIVGMLGAEASTGLLLATGLGARSMTDFVSCYIEAAQFDDPSFGSDLPALMLEYNRLAGIRNSLLHNTWHPDAEDEQHLLVLRFKGKVRVLEELWSADQREAVIDDIICLLQALSNFGTKFNLFAAFDRWEKQATSAGKVAPRQTAQPPARSPKIEEVLSRLLSSEE